MNIPINLLQSYKKSKSRSMLGPLNRSISRSGASTRPWPLSSSMSRAKTWAGSSSKSWARTWASSKSAYPYKTQSFNKSGYQLWSYSRINDNRKKHMCSSQWTRKRDVERIKKQLLCINLL